MDGDADRIDPPVPMEPMEFTLPMDPTLLTLPGPPSLFALTRRLGRCGDTGPENGCSLRASAANAAAFGDSVGRSIHASGISDFNAARTSENAGRSSGSLCQHCCRSATASAGSQVGSFGRLCRNATCTTICTGDESSSHGYFKVMSSHRTTANEYTLERSSVGSFRSTSGAIHSGVPPGDLELRYVLCLSRDMPKSETLRVQCESTNKFAGFRS
mmetsp:Transcript_6162/g.27752  ORF Transcript_6162/g.27752 Transcript_6162/m.27752 type:complete len:215 (-) Transcript_6162:2894-3538(-)